ncbi:hypothetical protein [Nocardia sp. NPDC005978]|uniref:hypothetical protein n=1 Tax=unclassified Nocardia TaxID=2637762 RepID=UPI0033BDB0EB
MIEPTTLLLPLGIWATLRAAAALGGGADLDYRQHEQRTAYAQREVRRDLAGVRD